MNKYSVLHIYLLASNNSKIINNKDKLDMRNSNTTSSSETMAMHVMPTQGIHSQGMPQSGEVSNMNNDIGKAGSKAGSKESFFAVDAIGNKIIQTGFIITIL